jgi:prepilin-type processing-associated H-X9-DG protein
MAHTSRDNTEQDVLNAAFDDEFQVLKVRSYGSDGQNLQSAMADNLQIKAVEDGGYTYFCFAAPGTTEATAKWKCYRLDGTANLLYADGNASYDNVATAPETLSYTYG